RVAPFGLAMAIVAACASSGRAPSPRISIVAGRLARWPVSGGCEVVEWTAPSGRSTRVCLDSSTAIEIERGDVRGFRIEDRQQGDQTWYVVSTFLSGGIAGRVLTIRH